jgi:Flp pilus assembly protein TadD
MDIELLERAHTMEPNNLPLRIDFAQCLVHAGRAQEALNTLSAEVVQTHIPGSLLKARALFQLGEFAQAEAVLHALSQIAPHDAVVWHDLAFAQLCVQDFDGALRSIERGLAIEDIMPFYLLWARVLHSQEDLENALVKIGIALAKTPADAEALGVFALLALDSNAIDEAKKAAEQALRIHPHQHESLIVLGDLLVRSKQTEPAIAHLQGALINYPNSPRLQTCYAQALLMHGDLPAATEFAQRSVTLQPKHLGSWHILAWGHLLQGQIPQARTSFESAFEADRNFSETLAGLAVVCALEGKTSQAQQWSKRARRLASTGATATFADLLIARLAGAAPGSGQHLAPLLAQIPDGADIDGEVLLTRIMQRLQPSQAA